jgi:hypothetical protein
LSFAVALRNKKSNFEKKSTFYTLIFLIEILIENEPIIMSMNNSSTLFSKDEDDDFLLSLVRSVPEIRVYADQPNLFAKYYNAQIKDKIQ